MPNELVPINNQVIKNLKDKLPIFKEGNNRTTKGIMNAWVGSLHVDNMTGGLYVRAEQLHTILRLGSRSDGQYLVDSVSKGDKIILNNEVYVVAYSDWIVRKTDGGGRFKKTRIFKTVRINFSIHQRYI